MVQNAAANDLYQNQNVALPHLLPPCVGSDFKALLFTYKIIKGLTHSQLPSLIEPYLSPCGITILEYRLVSVPRMK